ncbi:MAG TPA: SRPBCC family protein [Nitrosopumilus sp.]|nr:SRPBCC family protein [Nitrosopumilus sp.]HJO31856.1 SRPBCC family protein [Nitrosopumilus sp.]
MTKFTVYKIIHTKRKIIFDILSNFENFQKILPQHFPSIRVRSTRGNISVVEEHMMLGNKELVIMAKHVIQEPSLHEIFVIGGDAKGSHIYQQFIEHSEGTKVVVDVDLRLSGKMKLSGLFGNGSLEENYSKILDDFIKIAEN